MVMLATLFSAALMSVSATNDEGLKFLEEQRIKDGVIALPSGLLYKVLRAGDGDSHPTPDSSCDCHYEGRTAQNLAGDPFDSSYARGAPTPFSPDQVIKGMAEALQLMVEGDQWELCVAMHATRLRSP